MISGAVEYRDTWLENAACIGEALCETEACVRCVTILHTSYTATWQQWLALQQIQDEHRWCFLERALCRVSLRTVHRLSLQMHDAASSDLCPSVSIPGLAWVCAYARACVAFSCVHALLTPGCRCRRRGIRRTPQAQWPPRICSPSDPGSQTRPPTATTAYSGCRLTLTPCRSPSSTPRRSPRSAAHPPALTNTSRQPGLAPWRPPPHRGATRCPA